MSDNPFGMVEARKSFKIKTAEEYAIPVLSDSDDHPDVGDSPCSSCNHSEIDVSMKQPEPSSPAKLELPPKTGEVAASTASELPIVKILTL